MAEVPFLPRHRIGVDENGLGARLGPLVVTGVMAEVDERGTRTLSRKLPKALRETLDDSKRLVSHEDVRLGEAWARVLTGERASNPAELFEAISLEGSDELRKPCPSKVSAQCWSVEHEAFQAEPELVARVQRHRGMLEERGVKLLSARSSVICTERLNHARRAGKNRFVSDLHAMENVVLDLRREAATDVKAVCGKVGGMGEYSRFFGPLGGWLHVVLEQGKARSAYRFPGLGELVFERDADASDALVMLASLVGKYVRELFMHRIASHYPRGAEAPRPSGYHDPVTDEFVVDTSRLRRKRAIPDRCFERDRDPPGTPLA